MPEMQILHTDAASWLRQQAWYKKVDLTVKILPDAAPHDDLTQHFMLRWVAWSWEKFSKKNTPTLLNNLKLVEQDPMFEESEHLHNQWLSLVCNELGVPRSFVAYHFYLKTGIVYTPRKLKYILRMKTEEAGKDKMGTALSDAAYWRIRELRETQKWPNIAVDYSLNWKYLREKFRQKEKNMIREGKVDSKEAIKAKWQARTPKVR